MRLEKKKIPFSTENSENTGIAKMTKIVISTEVKGIV